MRARHLVLPALFVTALSLACCKSGDHAASSNPPPAATPAPASAAPAPASAPATATPAPAAEPALPTDPKELETARKKAILAGKYDLALKICAAEDVKSIGDQAILSCVLSACRQSDQARAAAWGKLLSGALKTEARKVCAASNVMI